MLSERYRMMPLVVAFLLTLGFMEPVSGQKSDRNYKGAEIIPGKIVVKFDPSLSGNVRGKSINAGLRAQEVKSQLRASVARQFGKSGIEVWNVSDVEKALDLARTIPGAIAVPNYVFKRPDVQKRVATPPPMLPGNPSQVRDLADPLLSQLWGLNNPEGADIDAFAAWAANPSGSITADGDTLYVVVMDTGIDKEHPDLIGAVVPNSSGYNYDAVYDTFEPVDEDGHGTHVAGTIGAVRNNGIGIAGVAGTVKLIDVRILDENGRGSLASILGGIMWVTKLVEEDDLPIPAVNMSFGGYLPIGSAEQALIGFFVNQAKRQEMASGTVWVAAAGNNALDLDRFHMFSWPNDLEADNVISVGSTTQTDEMSDFSNYGAFSVDLGAPGSYILSTVPRFYDAEFPYAFFSGTSMAAPHVTGAVAFSASRYPYESGLARVARVKAAREQISSLEQFWPQGGRLNMLYMVAPDSADQAPGVFYTPDMRFQLGGAEMESRTVGGILNATGQTISVTSYQITGPDAALFEIVGPHFGKAVKKARTAELNIPIIKGGAFGVAVAFVRPEATSSSRLYQATLTIGTSEGPVDILLKAQETRYAVASISPAVDIREEPLALGTDAVTAFNLSNIGEANLDYAVGQMLLADTPGESAISRYGKGVSRKPGKVVKASGGKGVPKALRKALVAAGSRIGKGDLKRITVSRTAKRTGYNRLAEMPNELLLWEDDFNNPDSVAKYWATLDFSEDGGTVWEHTEIGEGDYAFVFGDETTLYAPNSVAIALSPVFDFSSLGTEGIGPVNLYFDYSALMEQDYDIFGVGVFINGSFEGWIDATDFGLLNDGEANTAMLPVMGLTGYDDVSFAFIALSDESNEEGFGALFDNVALTIGDVPYYVSTYGGSLAPGAVENVTATVRTGMLPEGVYALLTMFQSNSIGIDTLTTIRPGFDAHLFVFASLANIGMDISPEFSELGSIPRNAQTQSRFSIRNSGEIPYSYASFTSVHGAMTKAKLLTRPEASAAYHFTQNAVAKRVAAPARKTPNKAAGLDKLLKTASEAKYRPKRVAQAKRAEGKRIRSKIVKSPRTAEHESILYYEDFESGMNFPEGWDVVDLSENEEGGTVWNIASLMFESNVNSISMGTNVAMFGSPESLSFLPLSFTAAFSPVLSLPEAIPGQQIYMELDYANMLEAGYDVFALVAYVLDPVSGEPTLMRVLGTSEDVFSGGMQPMGFAGFNLSSLAGSDIYLGFYVETDNSYNEGGFWFDNVLLASFLQPAWTTPSEGHLEPDASTNITLTIDGSRLYPGQYAAFTGFMMEADGYFPRFASQVTTFELRNTNPVALDDTLGVHSGDVIGIGQMIAAITENDFDPDGDELFVIDATDPIYGNWKTLTYDLPWNWDGPSHYVAPLNYDGWDRFEYLITDGYGIDTAVVYLAVAARPGFVRGSQQQFTVLEDHTLTINTIRMAAGVGGMDQDLRVWARSHHENVSIEGQPGVHVLHIVPAEDFWGQTTATFYVGHEGRPVDSMRVTIVVVPVNDAPVALFKVIADNGVVNFEDLSSDPRDPEGAIVKWAWNFGNGQTSELQNPTVRYTADGRYTVTLVVTDNGGLTAEYAQEVQVTVTSGENLAVPAKFAVYQNYPNPFNPATNVKFDLPQAAQVTITVYNTLGQEVARIANGAAFGAGQHVMPFDASRLASGLYMYRIEARTNDGKTMSAYRKMTLLK